MSDLHDDDQDLIAAEYVLGTLEADDVRRFQQRLVEDAGARAALSAWERRLGALGEELAPVTPPASVWTRVAERTGLAEQAAAPQARSSSVSGPASTSSGVPGADQAPAANQAGLRRWRGAAIAASAAAVVLLAVLLVGGSGTPVEPTYAGMLYDQPTGTSWLLTAKGGDTDTVAVETLQNYPVPSGKTLRLWVQNESGDTRLVGTLPHTVGQHRLAVSDATRDALHHGNRFVVTMDDTGASTAHPTGRVMWVSPIGRRTG